MTPTAQVVHLLKQSNIPGISSGHVHAYMIDPRDWSNTDCILRVSELPAGGHEYGNAVPINEKKAVQIDFYYPREYTNDMDLMEASVKSFLFAHKYRCYSDAGHVITPDSKSITNTLKFNYLKEDL